MKWQGVKAGDTVDIIAPGFAAKRSEIAKAIKKIKSWGLKPRIPRDLIGKDILCANTDEVRFRHLKNALTAKDSKVIWCLRGGYGSIRLLPQLNKLKKPKHKKIILGYSDITSLHAFVMSRWKWEVLHGPLVDSLVENRTLPEHEQLLRDVLFARKKELAVSKLTPLNKKAKVRALIKAPISGGNLTVVHSTLGMPWQTPSRDHIIFLEDLGERGYRIDRMLEHLRQLGFFEKTKAVIFGDFIGGLDPNGKASYWAVMERFAKQAKFPVFKGVPAGHAQQKMVLPMGTDAKIITGAKAKLLIATDFK